MSKTEARELAKKYIEEQRRVLESHGDSALRSKVKEAVDGAQRTFEIISTASAAQSKHK